MKKNILLLLIIILFLPLIVGCGNKKTTKEYEQEKIEEARRLEAEKKAEEERLAAELEAKRLEAERLAEEERLAKLPKGELNGLPISEEAAMRRPVAIMISNVKQALPQTGIASADILYETLAEGNITRFLAVFQDFDNKKIGPIRSARHYFMNFAFDHDAIFIHSGRSPQAQAAIKKWNVPSIDGVSYMWKYTFFFDKTRKQPHNTYTSFDKIMEGWDVKKFRKEVNDEEKKFKFSLDEEVVLEDGQDAKKLSLIGLSNLSKPYFEYDEESKEYLRYQFDEKQIDTQTNEQLHFSNIIVQYTKMWHIKGDDAGRRDMALIGSGEGLYLTRGKLIPIKWEKKSLYKPTKYYDESGKEILLNPGKTYVCVYPANNISKIEYE